jgi:hypothetical protein
MSLLLSRRSRLKGGDVGVVDESVAHRGADDLVAKDLAPPAERLVGGEPGAFVAAGTVQEQVDGLGLEGSSRPCR